MIPPRPRTVPNSPAPRPLSGEVLKGRLSLLVSVFTLLSGLTYSVATSRAFAQTEGAQPVDTSEEQSSEGQSSEEAQGAAEPDSATEATSPAPVQEGNAPLVPEPVSEPAHQGAESPEEREPSAAQVPDETSTDMGLSTEDSDDSAENSDDELFDDEDADLLAPTWNDERVLAWTFFGSGFGLSVLGAILFASGIDDVNTVENASGGSRWEAVEAAHARAPLLTGMGAAIAGLGIVGLGVGAALLSTTGPGGTWLEASIGPSGVSLRGRF